MGMEITLIPMGMNSHLRLGFDDNPVRRRKQQSKEYYWAHFL